MHRILNSLLLYGYNIDLLEVVVVVVVLVVVILVSQARILQDVLGVDLLSVVNFGAHHDRGKCSVG